jgi:hypothetical protein
MVEFADLLDLPDGLRLQSQAARLEQFGGDWRKALEVIEPVLAAVEVAGEHALLADALVTKGTALGAMSRFREATALIEAGQQLAETHGIHAVHARAVNNLQVILADSDVNQAFEYAQAGVLLARRLGQLNFQHTFVAGIAEQGLRLGDWDTSIAQLEGSLAESTDLMNRKVLITGLINLLALRGERRADLEPEVMEPGWPDPKVEHVLVPERKGYIALANGDLVEAERQLAEIAESEASPTGFLWPGHLAIWRGDADAAQSYRDRIPGGSHRGGTIQLTYEGFSAAIAGLRGDRRTAVSQYQAVSEKLVARGVVLDDCLLTISMIYAVGMDEPAVAEGASRARAALAKLRSRPLLDQLDGAVAHGPYTAASVATGTRRSKASASIPG